MTELVYEPAVSNRTEADAVADHSARPVTELLDDARDRAFLLPPGWSLSQHLREQFDEAPRRPRGQIFVYDAESFGAAVSARNSGRTTVYADEGRTSVYADESFGRLVAILNDDPAADGEVPAGWRDYRVELTTRPTPEWSRWVTRDGDLMPQERFVEHVEDSLADLTDPAPAVMLEIAQTIQATRNARLKGGIRLASGVRQFVYEENQDAAAGEAGTFEIPERLTLAISPFYGSARYELGARFRYRFTDGMLLLGYRLDRPDQVTRAAFADIRAHAATLLEGITFVNGPAPDPTRPL